MPAFRNLHTAVKDSLGKTPLPAKGNPLPRTVDDAITRMMGDYERIRTDYEPRGITPILIVVADMIANAERLFAELGGWRKDGEWVPGRFSILSNIDEVKEVKRQPPTLLVHSRMDETEKDTKLAGNIGTSDNSRRPRLGREAERGRADGGRAGALQHRGKEGQARRASALHRLRGDADGRMGCDGCDARRGLSALRVRPSLRTGGGGRALRRSVVPEPGSEQTAEYANIVGIPFLNMMTKEKGEPGSLQGEVGLSTLSLGGRTLASNCPGSADGAGISRDREPA